MRHRCIRNLSQNNKNKEKWSASDAFVNSEARFQYAVCTITVAALLYIRLVLCTSAKHRAPSWNECWTRGHTITSQSHNYITHIQYILRGRREIPVRRAKGTLFLFVRKSVAIECTLRILELYTKHFILPAYNCNIHSRLYRAAIYCINITYRICHGSVLLLKILSICVFFSVAVFVCWFTLLVWLALFASCCCLHSPRRMLGLYIGCMCIISISILWCRGVLCVCVIYIVMARARVQKSINSANDFQFGV